MKQKIELIQLEYNNLKEENKTLRDENQLLQVKKQSKIKTLFSLPLKRPKI